MADRSRMHKCAFLVAATLLAASCGQDGPVSPETGSERVWSGEYMVASANPLASEAGLAVLQRGGSAVDAAIAVQSVLSLVEPQSSGLGGGAFMLHYEYETQALSAFDGREKAPQSADASLLLDDESRPLGFLDAKISGRAVGVPGVTDMLALAHSEYGVLEWSTLFQSAIALAEDGFDVSPRMAESLAFADRFGLRLQPELEAYFSDSEGNLIQSGHRLRNPAYAETLRAISQNPRALYEPPLSTAIITATKAEPLPGGLTQSDFDGYEARRRNPICSAYRGNQVCGQPMPSSGGVAIAQIVGLAERIGWEAGGFENPENRARFAEIQRLAYADREAFAADDSAVDVPVAQMLAPAYLDSRAALIVPGKGAASVAPGDPFGTGSPGVVETPDSPGTSHFVIVDARGNVVSMTTTVESVFGSFRMAGGMILNNQLTDFTFTPRLEDGSLTANRPGPDKRPRSSMSPTIVLDPQGEFLFATGSPGGSSIIAYTAKSLIGVLEFGMTPQDAAAFPNIVARGPVRVEPLAESEGWEEDFAARGFPTAPSRGENSGIHSILMGEDGRLEGAADPRREGVVLAGAAAPEAEDARKPEPDGDVSE